MRTMDFVVFDADGHVAEPTSARCASIAARSTRVR